MAGKNDRLYALLMALLATLTTCALFLVGFGINSMENRLCSIHTAVNITNENVTKVTERVAVVETRQTQRLEQERLEKLKKY